MNKSELINFILENLSVNEGAYFHKKSKKAITKVAIEQLMDDIKPNNVSKCYKIYCRETIVFKESQNCLVSFVVYLYRAVPSYLHAKIEDCPKELIEDKSSYLLLIEFDNDIVIFKKNIVSLYDFDEYLTSVDNKALSSALISHNTTFEKLDYSNMGMANHSIRNRIIEGDSLAESMPILGLNRNIINSTRFKDKSNDNGSFSVNLGTSRIAKFGSKKDLVGLCLWSYEMVSKINAYDGSANFLSNFALPCKWIDYYNKLIPISILFDKHKLVDFFEERGESITLCRKAGKGFHGIERLFEKNLDVFSNSFDLQPLEGGMAYFVVNTIDPFLQVKVTDKRLSIESKGILGSLYIDMDGAQTKLLSFINQNALFQIAFSKCEYIYKGGAISCDANLQQSLNTILSILYPKTSMNKAEYEKVKGNKVTADMTDFGPKSIFHFVESEYFKDSEYILCDDLGDEWADHICLHNNTISFVHSKYKGKASLSAANFQDVIGQALKNIGHLQAGESMGLRRGSFITPYSGSKIQKIRKSSKGTINTEKVDAFIKRFDEICYNPNSTREVCLAVDFLSASEFKDAMSKVIKKEGFAHKGSTVQLFWLLASFISACRDADLQCRIICRK